MSSRAESETRRSLMLLRGIARFLYRFPGTGLPRVAESLRQHIARRAALGMVDGEAWINDFCGDLRFCCDLSEHMGSQIFFRGNYSGAQLNVLRGLLTEDSVFVDAGANQGEFTVCAAARVPHGQVFAFEPVENVRERLARNVQANGFRNVEIQAVGLSTESRDDVPIFGADSAFVDGTQHIGLPTLFDMNGRQLPLARISLRRLDDVLTEGQRVDVIKIDVEGAEFFVLKGAERTIQREQPTIIFEANAETFQAAGYKVEDIYAWLTEHGYKLERIGGDGQLTPVNGDDDRFCNILARPDGKGNWHAQVGSG